MVIHAYPEDYLTSAQRILGDMLDFAVNTYDMDANHFFEMFLVSDVLYQFQTGNPAYVAGKTGCELMKEVLKSAGIKRERKNRTRCIWINLRSIGLDGHLQI